MTDLRETITQVFVYLDSEGVPIPLDLYARAYRVGAIKAQGDLETLSATYRAIIVDALSSYFSGGIVTAPRNRVRQSTLQAFYDAFYTGHADSGGGVPDADGISWLDARVNQEFGFIDMLFQQVKEFRKEDDFDADAWIQERADGYARTLRELYNSGYLRGSKDVMVTFDGSDGKNSCPDCQRYKGQRHRVSWFVRRNAVPPHGQGLECHGGRRCKHYLVNDKGERVTV